MDAASSTTARAGVAAWLGLLFCLVFTLNTAGGWVRLSGSGVAIPHWPVIERGDGWTVLPPFSEPGWQEMYGQFNEHQERLQARVEAGELTTANLGRQPRDTDEFRTMFLTEWSHRFLAALTGVVAAGVLVTALRRRELRQVAGTPLAVAGVLILAQAVLGGLLVSQGTSTHWLFLHQGNAGLIMASILWAILRLLGDGKPLAEGRQGLRWLVGGAMVAIWGQLVLGALVAGSRHNAQGEVQLSLSALPHLWVASRDLGWNLLDNGWLHLWLHRWWAWGLSMLLAGAFVAATRTQLGIRGRLALQVSATFLVLQLIFGFASAALGALPFLALGHQALGMCLLLSVVLAWHDVRYEPSEAVEATVPPGVPA